MSEHKNPPQDQALLRERMKSCGLDYVEVGSEETDAIFGELMETYDNDYYLIADALTEFDPVKADQAARALAAVWRFSSNLPGFNQPPGDLVTEVEEIVGEPVWRNDV